MLLFLHKFRYHSKSEHMIKIYQFKRKLMKILVTGGGGYVGSELVYELAKNGHYVICIDRFSNGKINFGQTYNNRIQIVQNDIRKISAKILDGVDIVFDLAVLSKNLEVGKNDKEIFEVNHKARVKIAKLSKVAGVKKYVLGSSTSVYGQQKQIVNEKSKTKSKSTYDKANRKAENDVLQLNDDDFTVTVFRFSSIFGSSRKMRWDQSVNGMVLELFNTGKISVRGKNNRRPFIHIKDAIEAYKKIIISPKKKLGGQIFNVGDDKQNYDMEYVANEVANTIKKECKIKLKNSPDSNSHSASFKKIKKNLNFKTKHSLRKGIKQIYQELKRGKLMKPTKKPKVKDSADIGADAEFDKRNAKFIRKMNSDKKLLQKSKNWVNHVFDYEYVYHFRWLGRPIIQLPQDMIAVQELIWETKPDLIIESGIARGGSLIFYASILELLGHGRIIGIDIDIRKHNKKEIKSHKLFKRISMLEGSSTDNKIFQKVKNIAKNKKKIMVLLDSNHSEEHVTMELKKYSEFVKKGNYLIVFDTMMEDMDKHHFNNRPWDHGNNPRTAVWNFLKENKRFKIDKNIQEKLLITSCPDGYLKCVKN